jgi:hypothetical protein
VYLRPLRVKQLARCRGITPLPFAHPHPKTQPPQDKKATGLNRLRNAIGLTRINRFPGLLNFLEDRRIVQRGVGDDVGCLRVQGDCVGFYAFAEC